MSLYEDLLAGDAKLSLVGLGYVGTRAPREALGVCHPERAVAEPLASAEEHAREAEEALWWRAAER